MDIKKTYSRRANYNAVDTFRVLQNHEHNITV